MNSKLLLAALVAILALPQITFAQIDFRSMVNIPGVDPSAGVGSYINALYLLAISAAAFLAVIRLMMAGVKYMFTDVVPSKESAKKDIRSALVGLLIVIGAALILETINPNLRSFGVFENLNADCAEDPALCQGYTPPAPSTTPDLTQNDLSITCEYTGNSANCRKAERRCAEEFNGTVVKRSLLSASLTCRPGNNNGDNVINPPLNPDGGLVETQTGVQYYQRQNQDQIAAGAQRKTLEILGTSYVDGTVEVRIRRERKHCIYDM